MSEEVVEEKVSTKSNQTEIPPETGSDQAEPPKFVPSKDNLNQDSTQTLLHSKFITHNTKAGLNPLVDAAGYLFSSIGKLSILKSYRNFDKLQKELIDEINTFQETAKLHGYASETILVARYALCATTDDIISHTSWGKNGKWDDYRLLTIFNQDSPRQNRFFLILERIIKDPGIYIDLMEFMYICLSLGFKGEYRNADADMLKYEKIAHALYKHIRAYRGDFSKTLSPYLIKATKPKNIQNSKASYLLAFFVTTSVIMLLFIGLSLALDSISNSTYKELISIGKAILYETNS